MHASTLPATAPPRERNRSLARSFYRQLRSEGLTDDQIFELASSLLDLVGEDPRELPDAAR